MNRIFISYRSADGGKDASRLAEDLGRVFGDEHVFLDRQDLRGGSSWRAEIAGALDHRPVALFLITPAFAGARHPDGRLRIVDADDPVRCEIQAAVDAGATLMPLLIDGTTMPAADSLPEALRGITEMHALPLRTDDWVRVDFPRLVADLERLGVQRTDRRSVPATASAAAPSGSTRVAWLAGVTALLVVIGLVVVFRPASVPTVPGSAADVAVLQSLEGDWVLETPKGEQIPLHVRHRDDRLVMRSDPVRVDDKPNWQSYIESVASVNGTRLTHVRFTAEGQVFGNEADLAVVVISVGDGFVVDTGNLHLRIAPDRRVLSGQVSLNSGEQESVALTRSR
jgi:hypothetical protein